MVMSDQMEDREFDNFILKTAEEQIAILKERCKDFDTTIQDLQIKLQRLKELEARRQKRKQIVKSLMQLTPLRNLVYQLPRKQQSRILYNLI